MFAAAPVVAEMMQAHAINLGPHQNDNSPGNNNIQGAGLCGVIGGCENHPGNQP